MPIPNPSTCPTRRHCLARPSTLSRISRESRTARCVWSLHGIGSLKTILMPENQLAQVLMIVAQHCHYLFRLRFFSKGGKPPQIAKYDCDLAAMTGQKRFRRVGGGKQLC